MRKELEKTFPREETAGAISVAHLLNPAAHFDHPNGGVALTDWLGSI